jgi:subtilisin family serine protease
MYDISYILDPTFYGLPGYYRYDYSGKGVQAYIIDSGIQQMHNEFTTINEYGEITGSRVSCGHNFRANLNETCDDGWGHGTHVAGIIGGKTYGVAKDVSLIAVKVFGADASCRFADILAAIEFVMEQKELDPSQPMLINLSLGTSQVSEAINIAVDQVSCINCYILPVTKCSLGNYFFVSYRMKLQANGKFIELDIY